MTQTPSSRSAAASFTGHAAAGAPDSPSGSQDCSAASVKPASVEAGGVGSEGRSGWLKGPSAATCHVLVVGGRGYVDQVRQTLADAQQPARVKAVADYLMALGQTSRVKPDVVIGQVDTLGSLRDAVLTGLRRLSGQTRLLVTASPDQEHAAIAAVEAGFDGYLLEPLDPAMLQAAIAREVESDSSTSPAVSGQDALPGAWSAEADDLWPVGAGLADMPAASASPVASSGGGAEAGRDVSAAPAAGPSVAAGAGPSAGVFAKLAPAGPAAMSNARPRDDEFEDTDDAELGDVDLVDELLYRPATFRQTVLKLVATRSGIAGVDLAAAADQVPQGHVGVWATYRGRRLGVLHAPPPTAKAQLSPWASWLAHWLALERKINALWDMAHKDELSGAWNRRHFDRHLTRVLQEAAQKRFPVTLLVFDIDNFKMYNDRYGHAAGDEILRETVRLMRSVVREHDIVARIGGDEFAVIFWDPQGPRKPQSSHPDDVRKAAQRFQQAICSHQFPKLLEEAPGTLTISGGLASFPWDGATPQALLERADAMLLHSKAHGKNAITYGSGAAREADPFDV